MAGTENLALYHFEGCPYCARVRMALARLGIEVELRDVLRDPAHARALLEATGRRTVPCLRIEGLSEDRWMHESEDIVRYLEAEFG